jgi:hypothetical protein
VERFGFVAIDPENRAERGSDMAHQSYDFMGFILVI